MTRPLWMMWRDNALDLPHFGTVIGWLLSIVEETLGLTPEGHEQAKQLKAIRY